VDADGAGDTDNRRSHAGYILMMNDNRFLGRVAVKTTYLCLLPKPNSLLHAKPGKRPYIFVGPSRILATNKTLPLKSIKENVACVAMSENPVRRKFSRHIDICRYFVRELVKAGFVKLMPLYTHKMVADAITKSLSSPAFIGHRRVMMGQTPFVLKFVHS